MKAIIFDLDGTLYRNKDIEKQNIIAAINAIATHNRITLDDASALLEKNRSKYTSTSGILAAIGVPNELVKSFQLKLIHPDQSINSDLELCSKIRALKQSFKLLLLTNTRREIADRIIKKLGFMEGDFDLVMAGGDFSPPKPSVEVVKQALEMVSADAVGSYAVGDRWRVDLEPAKVLNMSTVEVKTRDELLNWIDDMLSHIR
jgi:putative hydrolase of the HAD superfamily